VISQFIHFVIYILLYVHLLSGKMS